MRAFIALERGFVLMSFSRRKFLSTFLGASVVAATSAPAAIVGLKTNRGRKLKLGAIGILASRPVRRALKEFSENVNRISGGEFQVEILPENLAFTGPALIHAIRAENLALALHSPSLESVPEPATAFFGGMPLGLHDNSNFLWLTDSGTETFWRKAYEPKGLVPLFFGCNPSMFGQFSREPIIHREALHLRKVGIAPGASSLIWRSLGAEIRKFSSTASLAEALQREEIDLTPPIMHSANFLWREKVPQGYSYHVQSELRAGHSFHLLLDSSFWAQLGESGQALLRQSAKESSLNLYRMLVGREKEALRKIEAARIPVSKFPDDLNKVFRAYCENQARKQSQRSELAGDLYQHFLNFRVNLG
jgi:TRAP-type mannitol/chloroaromatic compound transport system substrate-binding protein